MSVENLDVLKTFLSKKVSPIIFTQFLLEHLIGEINDAKTRKLIVDLISSVYIDLYEINCSEGENPPEVIDKNEIKVELRINDIKYLLTLGPSSKVDVEAFKCEWKNI